MYLRTPIHDSFIRFLTLLGLCFFYFTLRIFDPLKNINGIHLAKFN